MFRDVLYAFRQVRRDPRMLVVAGILGTAAGATAALVVTLDATVLRPVPPL